MVEIMTRLRWILIMALAALLSLSTSMAQDEENGIVDDVVEGFTFDQGDELWRSEGGANLSWMERGGNPGGFLLGEDADENETWYYVSPESWSGNWTSYIGYILIFDIRLIDDDNSINLDFSDILKIYSLNDTFVAWPGSTAPWPSEPKIGEWTRYEIPLEADSFGINESEFLETMENVDRILIRGEYSDGRDLEGLDNVIVAPPQKGIADRPGETSDIQPDPPIELAVKPEPFYRRSTNVTSGVSNHGGSGDGSSSSRVEGERILLYCDDTGFSSHWASGTVWDEFVYDKEDHLCKAALKCHVKGGIATVGVPDIGGLFSMDLFKSSAELKVYMILEDKTEDFVVDKVLIYSTAFKDKAYLDEYIDEWRTGEIEAELMKDHLYQLKLEAVASSSTIGLASLIVDFCGLYSEGYVKWSYGEVKWI
ncbi:hypothetical protein P0O24_09115 [Methanotrichaceae archaeon M04Ac]|uniref:Uncharacterized protein n=1 Tax=Candidatus Methanocrinis alkalitolerans TaxID=3033395 RepID=A0ABT5XGJ1_9EURY|nr:hypothetical protein [Candidatus Methanocrinis alkalitolerans]MDF0593743.1 hypothetical protein [Candidatus Methanocrinis alkalitolerans]